MVHLFSPCLPVSCTFVVSILSLPFRFLPYEFLSFPSSLSTVPSLTFHHYILTLLQSLPSLSFPFPCPFHSLPISSFYIIHTLFHLHSSPSPSFLRLPLLQVLDASLRTALDMSKMTRSMVDQLILSRDNHTNQNNHHHHQPLSGFGYYSSDFTSSSSTSSSPSSLSSKSPFDDSCDSESEARRVS